MTYYDLAPRYLMVARKKCRLHCHGKDCAKRFLVALIVAILIQQCTWTGVAARQTGTNCAGADIWLTETEQRFFLGMPFALADEDDIDPLTVQVVLLTMQQDQASSVPPPAAEGLNSQILAHFAQLSASLARLLAGGEIGVFMQDIDQAEDAVRVIRSMTRELKVVCHLTNSGEFFDAPCYGPLAGAWYDRTNHRIVTMRAAMATADGELQGGLSYDEETALANRLEQSLRDLLQVQSRDSPPAEFPELQQHYLDLYQLLADMFSEAMIADEPAWQRYEFGVDKIGEAMDREKARLDIACVPRPQMGQADDSVATDVTDEDITTFCSTGPIYEAGDRFVLRQPTFVYEQPPRSRRSAAADCWRSRSARKSRPARSSSSRVRSLSEALATRGLCDTATHPEPSGPAMSTNGICTPTSRPIA